MADEKPWFAPGHVDSLTGTVCQAGPREPLWTLIKGGKRVDAELLYHAEHGVEIQFLFQGVMAYGHRCVLRAEAVEEADAQRARLLREDWTAPITSHPAGG